MSLTGVLLDVSGSMRQNIGSGTDEEGGPWAQSIFEVIYDLIEHDVSDKQRVFAIGVGGKPRNKEIFDIIGSLQELDHNDKTPATKAHINQILEILERNGARNIRKWAGKIAIIQDEVTDKEATLIMRELQSDEQFLKKFVDEFLPSGCKDRIPDDIPAGVFSYFFQVVEDAIVSGVSYAKQATREEIKDVVRKATDYLRKDASRILKNVGAKSIFSAQDASRIIRGRVDEELSEERKRELLKSVEPFIYGGTPLFESLEKATKLFERDASKDKLLVLLSDGDPSDGSNKDSDKINEVTDKLTKAGVTIVSCFITKSTNIHPKHLFDEMQPGWETGAKFLFSLSSEVPTQHLPRAILVKRGWTIDIANNETKLFAQVNHPDNLREACEMAKSVVCSSDALSELLVSVHLDMYINGTTRGIRAKDQGEDYTCYAIASATVLHLAMERIHGRQEVYPSFEALKDKIISEHGKKGARTFEVLQKICPNYHLHCRKVYMKGAKEAIVEKRLVVAIFYLTNNEWDAFKDFYDTNPFGILTQNELDVRKRPKIRSPRTSGHAVVLTSYNSKCLTFMNSWGEEWGDKGFFRVQNAEVLRLEFFDVYWTLNDLSEGEKEHYRKHGSEVATNLMNSLKGLQKAEYTCPECKQTSLVTQFEGTLSKVGCPKCSCKFSANDNAGNILALNMYLTSLSR